MVLLVVRAGKVSRIDRETSIQSFLILITIRDK
jgi:hypothetical protein